MLIASAILFGMAGGSLLTIAFAYDKGYQDGLKDGKEGTQ